jgi:hypothetical protein
VIELADEALARLPADAAAQAAFDWAHQRIARWKTDAGLLASAYAWEGFHRGEPGRALAGLNRTRPRDGEDVAMMIEALIAVGREGEAHLAAHHHAGVDGDQLGDGKGRLAAAKAMLLAGDLDGALEAIAVGAARRSQGRLEAEINRLLRLAAIHDATAWTTALARLDGRGATTLARLAARDLADFVPGLDTALVRRLLGEAPPLVLDPSWLTTLIEALPAVAPSAPAIVRRLAWPAEATLAAADTLAAEWWSALVPSARDRDAHAGGAVLALAIALGNYLVACGGAPTPIAGAYRHIATEALQLVRRARYQLDGLAVAGVLRYLEPLAGEPTWLVDPWLLRVERALDLEAEHGAFLDGLLAELPRLRRLLRGDERIGWELRLAHDLAVDPSQYEAAATLFERAARAVDGGTVTAAWSAAAPEGELDVHWLAAIANPELPAPWLRVAYALLGEAGGDDAADTLDTTTTATAAQDEAAERIRRDAALDAACRGLTRTAREHRATALATLAPRWRPTGVPLAGDDAYAAGLAAASELRLDDAIRCLRWAAAVDPTDAERAQSLAVALARTGQPAAAIRALAVHERTDAPRLVGRILLEAGYDEPAVEVLRYASRRFRAAEDWATLVRAATRAGNDVVVIEAGRRALAAGGREPELHAALATALYRLGEFVECEQIAQLLISNATVPRELKAVGLHAMARALAGQGRHVEAYPFVKAASELVEGEPPPELVETIDCIIGQEPPPTADSPERSMERRAFAELERGEFDGLFAAAGSPSWGIARAALAAAEFRRDDESGVPVSPRALDAALAILGRSRGTTQRDATLARIRALRIRDNAFIQIDPPPPLGARMSADEFEQRHTELGRRSKSTSAERRR